MQTTVYTHIVGLQVSISSEYSQQHVLLAAHSLVCPAAAAAAAARVSSKLAMTMTSTMIFSKTL